MKITAPRTLHAPVMSRTGARVRGAAHRRSTRTRQAEVLPEHLTDTGPARQALVLRHHRLLPFHSATRYRWWYRFHVMRGAVAFWP